MSNTGVITPFRSCMFTTSEMRFPGARATTAPTTSCTVKSPKKTGARRKLSETERSPPIPSAIAYELESGTTTRGQQRRAEQSDAE